MKTLTLTAIATLVNPMLGAGVFVALMLFQWWEGLLTLPDPMDKGRGK